MSSNLYVPDNQTNLFIPSNTSIIINNNNVTSKVILPPSPIPSSSVSSYEIIIPIVLPIMCILVLFGVAITLYLFARRRKPNNNIGNDDHLHEPTPTPKLTHCHFSYFSLNFPSPPQTDMENPTKVNQELKNETTSVYYDSLEYQDFRNLILVRKPEPCRSSIYTEPLTSPTSPISRISSVLLTAERQRLYHEKPKIFCHFP